MDARGKLRPQPRGDLLLSELGDEAVVYDFSTQRAHCIGPLALRVFRACDGRRTVAQVMAEAGVSDEDTRRALAELAKADLVSLPKPVDRGRRRALSQLTLTAGLTAAAPLVWSIVAPSVAEAASRVS